MPLTTSGRIFLQHGQPWRWKGVSAFSLWSRFATGQDIAPFLQAFAGFNVLRVWPYVTWPGTGWDTPAFDSLLPFLRQCAEAGFYVELTLLTDDDAARLAPARTLVAFLAADRPANVLLEIGNEPQTHKDIDTPALKAVCDASGFLYSSGDYEDSDRHFGSFLTHHSSRDDEWPRKAHDAMEFYNGGGPHAKTDPAHKVPIVLDEPKRPDQAGDGKQHGWPYLREQDFIAYFAGASLFGAGATYHYESGKYGREPDADEARFAAIALEGLNAFPADAPNGAYRLIDEDESLPTEGTLSTYIIGNHMVRIRPKPGTGATEPGWNSLDPAGILWSR